MDVFAYLNSLTPLGLAALLGVVIYMLVKQRTQMGSITDNHLHELPEIATSIREMKDLLQKMNDHLVYIRARINGR